MLQLISTVHFIVLGFCILSVLYLGYNDDDIAVAIAFHLELIEIIAYCLTESKLKRERLKCIIQYQSKEE